MEKSSGVSFWGLLTCIFIALKLTGNIEWHWFWVLSPIVIPTIFIILIAVIVYIIDEIS